MLLFQIPS